MKIPISNFPEIHTIDDVLVHIKDNKSIINFKNKNRCQVLAYQVQSPETFNNPYTLECRGITFDKTGKIIGRPLHKFFNIGEFDKLDDSMITLS